MQTPLRQQPASHTLPEQQGSPGLPQAAHKPLDTDEVVVHTVPFSQRSMPFAPEQQASPGPPHVEQIPPRHARPGPQLVPQHG